MEKDFISIYDSMPALNMLCDIKLKTGSIKKTRLVSKGMQSPYLVWIGQEDYDKKNGAVGVNPPNFISHWRYNESASKEEIEEWLKELKAVNKDDTL